VKDREEKKRKRPESAKGPESIRKRARVLRTLAAGYRERGQRVDPRIAVGSEEKDYMVEFRGGE